MSVQSSPKPVKTPEGTSLTEDTLERIGNLLVKNEWAGKNRGLYTLRELKQIRYHLIDLAEWLRDNPPQFIKDAPKNYTKHDRFSEKTTLCISYIDHIRSETDESPAKRLQNFYNSHLSDLYSHLHILPHFKSPIIHEGVKGPAARADGGFEALDFKMDPYYGTAEDLDGIEAELMFDFVLNHLSVEGDWFKKFLEDEEGYEDFFVTIPEDQIKDLDWDLIFRPREHNPLIAYQNSKGETKHVWCTFSATQADINIKNPKVFCALMEALVKDFIGQGASWVRLDAVGYLVKMFGIAPREASTHSFGIEETHNVLKAIRAYFTDVAPALTLVPEVNATKDVIKTYYGENHDEGHLVYEFPSAPLSLYSIYQNDASAIMDWAQERNKDPECIGLAFTNSHDGIGVLPMADVPDVKRGTSALDELLHQIERRGGGINYKSKVINGKQKRVPYEACITWLQATMSPPEHAALMGNRLTAEETNKIVDRFLASQSFIYSAPHCVPADYMGVITGLLNEDELYYIAGHRRNKNRGLVSAENFAKALENPVTDYEILRAKIFNSKKHLIQTRRQYSAFSPYAKCEVGVVHYEANAKRRPIYSVLRTSPHNDEKILTLTNCHKRTVSGTITVKQGCKIENILGNDVLYNLEGNTLTVTLDRHQIAWLKIVE